MKQQETDRRSQRTYHLVSAAFTELLLEKPYDEILVQDILDRADVVSLFTRNIQRILGLDAQAL